tara:strand:- start:525 stop:806 length:282 start_codon:yes stop_codon:yes gene_type:complete
MAFKMKGFSAFTKKEKTPRNVARGKRKAETGSPRKNVSKEYIAPVDKDDKGFILKQKYDKKGDLKKVVKIQGGKREKTLKRGGEWYDSGSNID